MDSEARKAAKAKWDAENMVQVKVKLHKRKDVDILQRLEEVPSKQGYIKDLIRKDMSKGGE